MNKKISVIVPAYNAEKSILDTLNNLRVQEYQNFEVVIVDDGSVDNTNELVGDFIKEYNLKWKLIKQVNKGEGFARNIGIKNSIGEYILFLDADDFLSNDALSIMYKSLIENNAEMVFSSYSYVYENGERKLYHFDNNSYTNIELIELFSRRIINIGIGNTLFKSSIVKDNNILFGNYKAGADNEFFRKLSFYVNKTISVRENLFFYMQNSLSVMNTKYTFNRMDSVYSVLDTKKYIIERNFNYKYNEWNNIFLINEIKSNAIGYVMSRNKIDQNLLLSNILNYLPFKTSFSLFLSKKRFFWLLSLFIFYKLPRMSLYIFKLLITIKKILKGKK